MTQLSCLFTLRVLLALPLALSCAADPLLSESDTGVPLVKADSQVSPSPAPGTAGGCSAVRGELLGQVDAVSPGEVHLESDGTPRVVYVDASAGGFQNAAAYPYVYFNLEQGKRVDITDLDADSSLDWDLAFKRFTIRTNSGDSGLGQGGAFAYAAEFEQLTRTAVAEAAFVADDFVDDATCEPIAASSSGVEGIATPFSGWYSYDSSTMVLTPRSVVYVVRSAQSGALYKLQISDYYASPAGGSGASSGRYRFTYQALK